MVVKSDIMDIQLKYVKALSTDFDVEVAFLNRRDEMRRRYLTIENGIAVVLAVGGLVAGIAVRDVEMKVCFLTLTLSAIFYLVLSVLDTGKSVCTRCGRRIWDKRTGESDAKRIDTLDDRGEVVRITVVCPKCGERKTIWEK